MCRIEVRMGAFIDFDNCEGGEEKERAEELDNIVEACAFLLLGCCCRRL